MFLLTAKDCKIWIGVSFAIAALLVTLDAFWISSRVVAEKQHVTPSYVHIDSSKWSHAMLRASRSRVSPRVLERMEQEKQERHLLLTTNSDSLYPSTDSHENDEVMVSLFDTKWQDIVHLFWNHKFVGIFPCRNEPMH